MSGFNKIRSYLKKDIKNHEQATHKEEKQMAGSTKRCFFIIG